MLRDINEYYHDLLADAVQVAKCVSALRSLCWAPVNYYMKYNWEKGRSKCKQRLTQFGLFILYIVLITSRVFSLTLMAVSSAFAVYLYIFRRSLVMLSLTLVNDKYVEFSRNWGEYQQSVVNVCRAVLYVFVDINFTDNSARFFFSIAFHVIVFVEDVLIITYMLPLLTNDSADVGKIFMVVTVNANGVLLALIFCCYPLFVSS